MPRDLYYQGFRLAEEKISEKKLIDEDFFKQQKNRDYFHKFLQDLDDKGFNIPPTRYINNYSQIISSLKKDWGEIFIIFIAKMRIKKPLSKLNLRAVIF